MGQDTDQTSSKTKREGERGGEGEGGKKKEEERRQEQQKTKKEEEKKKKGTPQTRSTISGRTKSGKSL